MFNENFIRHKMKIIQSNLDRIGTYDICQTYLSFFNDKHYIFNDGVNSLAYFHKDVRIQ